MHILWQPIKSQLECFSISLAGRHRSIQQMNTCDCTSRYVVSGHNSKGTIGIVYEPPMVGLPACHRAYATIWGGYWVRSVVHAPVSANELLVLQHVNPSKACKQKL